MSGSSFATLRRLDELLERAGHFPMSRWWLGEAERFYTHQTARTWVGRVGRGGAKSTTAVKIALNEILFGDFPAIGPGERHFFAFVSVSRDEAAQRLRLLESCLTACGIGFERSGETIAIANAPRGFKVLTASVAGVSGFRCLGWAVDEAAKLRGDDGANPSREIVASLRAMTVTHPGARSLLFSSPMSTLDFHFESVERGNTDRQIVSIAPSWVANPDAITEARTRELEPDARVWAREYQARPQAAVLAALDAEAVARAFKPRSGDGYVRAPRIVAIDASSGRGDAFAWIVAGWNVNESSPWLLDHEDEPLLDVRRRPVPNKAHVPREPFLAVDTVESEDGAFWRVGVRGADVVAKVVKTARARGCSLIVGDQREALMLESEVERHGLRYVSIPWSAPTKQGAMERLRRWLSDKTLSLPAHDKLRAQLASFEERITDSGTITYGGRGAHDDHAACVLTLAMADAAGLVPMSPFRHRAPRGRGLMSTIGLF